MRLFIAVDLAPNMKKSLVGIMHEMKKQAVQGSYVPMQNLHMTLAFIGEWKDPEQVMGVLRGIPLEKSRLSFSDYGNFGDVFWIGIKGNQKIKKYAADLRKALADQGLPCDKSKFQPHVTLLRGYKGRKIQGLAVPGEDMMITRVSLMKSEMKDGKRVYTEIGHI